MSRKSARVFQGVLGIGVSAVVIFFIAARRGDDHPIRISTVKVARQDLSSSVSTNGKVEAVEPRIIQSQLTTFVESVLVKDGQKVSRGQLLLTLDTTELRSELAHLREQLLAAQEEQKTAAGGGATDDRAQLEADLAKVNTEIARLRREADALQRLYAKQAATREELDQNKLALDKALADKGVLEHRQAAMASRAKTAVERAGLRIDEARNSIRSLEEKINSGRVLAPISGTLYALPARAGTLVHTGDLLGEIADLSRVRVRVFVDEPDLGSLKEGQSVQISWDGLPDQMWMGRVEQLPKTIVGRGSRNVGEILCSVQNQNADLLPNSNVNARIETAQHVNALVIPRSAIRTEGADRYVFVVSGDRLKKQKVMVGIANATEYEILSGLTEDDVVALPGAMELHEDQAVMTGAG
jgi:HlyD family secretion protein